MDGCDPASYLQMAMTLSKQGRLHDAIQLLLHAIKQHPQDGRIGYYLGTLYHAQADWQEAIRCYEWVIERQPNQVEAYYHLGLALAQSQQREAAAQVYQMLLKRVPEHAAGRFQLGCLFMAEEQFEPAIACFLWLVKAHHYVFEAYTNLATCCLRLGRLHEAKSYYWQAHRFMPMDQQVLFNLGVVAMQQGQVAEAIQYYLLLLQIDSSHFEAHYNIAVAYWGIQEKGAAWRHVQAAARLCPQHEVIQHMMAILQQDQTITRSPPVYIQMLFDAYADHYEKHLQGLNYQVPERLYQALEQAGAFVNRKVAVLDLGCGTGKCGEYVASDARYLIGVDLSANMLKVAAQKQLYDTLVKADLFSFLTHHQGTYDVMVSGDVMVYFGALEALFAAIQARLCHQGIVAFTTEQSMEQDYVMTASGRFAHHPSYLDRLAKHHHFTVLRYETLVLRLQHHQEVRGQLYVWQKSV